MAKIIVLNVSGGRQEERKQALRWLMAATVRSGANMNRHTLAGLHYNMTEMAQQWDEDGFCTCELEVITCSAVAVGLVIITLVHQVPIGSGRSSCRC